MRSLTRAGIIAGAKVAAAHGLSFSEYCALVASILVSGQSSEQVKAILERCGIEGYFRDVEKGR